jgi:hypothetical protein
MKKALTHLSLEATNAGKLARLDAVAIAYQCQTQAYVNVLIARGERMPDQYAPYPAGGYGLSERWLRCAWQLMLLLWLDPERGPQRGADHRRTFR